MFLTTDIMGILIVMCDYFVNDFVFEHELNEFYEYIMYDGVLYHILSTTD